MIENSENIKRTINPLLIVSVSIGIYIISLTQIAFTVQTFEGLQKYSSINVLLIGAIAFLGGGGPEELIWLANPVYIISIYLFLTKNKSSRLFGFIALSLSFSFLFWTKILTSESGQESPIIDKGLGYWLWLLSILILAIGIQNHFKSGKEFILPQKEKMSKAEIKEQEYYNRLKKQIEKDKK